MTAAGVALGGATDAAGNAAAGITAANDSLNWASIAAWKLMSGGELRTPMLPGVGLLMAEGWAAAARGG